MPNTNAAKKRMRQNEKRKLRHRAKKAAIRTFARKVEEAVKEDDAGKAQDNFKILQSKLDKAAKACSIHRNKAARRKSRTQKQLNALKKA